MKSKKGATVDLLMGFTILVFIGILVVIFGFIGNKIATSIQGLELAGENTVAASAQEKSVQLTTNVPEMLLFLFFLGFNIGIFIIASRTKFTLGAFALFIILAIISVAIAAGWANVIYGLGNLETVSGYTSQLTFFKILFSQWTPLIMCVINGISLIIMYSKSGIDVIP